MKPTYSVKITRADGFVSYLSLKGQTCWSKRTALRHLRSWQTMYGGNVALEEN